MATSSNNPDFVILRERIDDLAAYLELWNQRASATDKAAARAAGSMAMERISAVADQLSGMSRRLLGELRAFDDGVAAADDPLLKRSPRRDDRGWFDTGTGPGYEPPRRGDQTDDAEHHDPRD